MAAAAKQVGVTIVWAPQAFDYLPNGRNGIYGKHEENHKSHSSHKSHLTTKDIHTLLDCPGGTFQGAGVLVTLRGLL